jgi:hypothetical protein
LDKGKENSLRSERLLMIRETHVDRPIKFVKIVSHRSWKLKVYHITAFPDKPISAVLLKTAIKVARQRLNQIKPSSQDPHVGFIGIHEGTRGIFLFLDWWEDHKELHHNGFYAKNEGVLTFHSTTKSDSIGCIWDLKVLSFEAEAWTKNMMGDRYSINDYLDQHMNSG